MIKENCDDDNWINHHYFLAEQDDTPTGWELCIDDFVLTVINTEKQTSAHLISTNTINALALTQEKNTYIKSKR